MMLLTDSATAVIEAGYTRDTQIALEEIGRSVPIVQETGTSETKVMSQKAVTEAIYTKNEIDLSQYNFSQGGFSKGNNVSSDTRCSTQGFIPITEDDVLIVQVADGYKVEVDFYDANKTYINYKGWLSTSGEVALLQNTKYIKVAIALISDAPITPDVAIDKAEIVIYANKVGSLLPVLEDIKNASAEKDFMRIFLPATAEETFYVEFDYGEPAVYIKFDQLRVRGYANGQWVSANYTTETLATDCGATLITSVKGKANCLKVQDEYALIYDLSQRKFQIVNRTSVGSKDYNKIPIILSESGRFAYCISSLLRVYLENETKKLNAKIEAIPKENEIPTYWESAVATAESKIEQYQNNGGINTFTFGFITDTHVFATTDGAFAELMKRVIGTCDIPIFLHGGDIVYGSGIISKNDLIDQLLRHKEIFKDIEEKCLLAFGNHDSAYGITSNWDSALTDGEIYNYIFRKDQNKNDIVFGDTGRYFYKDIPSQKARYIVLDCYDFETQLDGNTVISNNKMQGGAKLGTTQLEWLANVALKVPENYSVVICSHQPPYRASDKNSIGWTGEDCLVDAEVALGIVNAYRNKTTYTYNGTLGQDASLEAYAVNVDFAQYDGDLVCWVVGHTHKDYIFDLDGLKVVSTANCSAHQSTTPEGFAPTKTSGTDTEYILDFLCVNKSTRKCNIVRLGAEMEENVGGRSFTY
jgi:hypothetical protein